MTDSCLGAPLTPYLEQGELIIDGLSLHKTCWSILDLSELFSSPEFRGENPLIETLPGRPAAPGLSDQLDVSLPLAFTGAVDPNGDPYPGHQEGLYRNRQLLHEHIIDPIRSGTATLPATLNLPGTSVAFDIQPIEFFGWILLPKALGRTVLRVIVPSSQSMQAISSPYEFSS